MDEPMNEQEDIRPVEDTEEDDAADKDDCISWGLEYDVFEDVASALEEFVRLNHLKRFVEAEDLYRSCLFNHQDWFPVLAEFAEHLLLRRSYEELAEFSDHFLRVVKDSREMQVLIMMRVIADIHLKKPFQDAIIQTSIIWHHFPIDYKETLPIDTEIHILELLLQAAVLTKGYCGPLNIELHSLPQFLHETDWEFFITWFHRLFDHGYYWEAHRIFRWLLEVLPLPKAKALLKSNLEAARQLKNRTEAFETAVSASLQVFMQHLEGVGSPDDSEWNDFVTKATFEHLSGCENNQSFFESDNAILEHLQDIIECPLPLIHDQKNGPEPHNPFPYATFDLEQCLVDLTEASDLSRYDVDAIFRTAAKEGHVLLVRLLSKLKEVVESKDLFQQKPLHLAAANGHDDVIRILVDDDTKTECEDWFGRSPIYLAAKNGHVLVLELLLDKSTSDDFKKDKFWSMALRCAVENGREAVVRLLLDNNRADTKVAPDTLILAVRRGHQHIVRLLLKVEVDLDINARDAWGWTPLMSAIYEGNNAIIKVLEENGAHEKLYQSDYEDQYSQTPLLYSIKQEHDALVDLLLRQGDKSTEFNAQGGYYGNALQTASSGGHQKIVRLLLKSGADVNAQGGYYGNALQEASSGGRQEMVRLLLESGADVNAQGGYYGNALQAASSGGHQKIVRLLLESGADVNAQGGYYGNALQEASSGGHQKIVRLLLESGADVNAQGGYYGNALQAASSRGHQKIVRLLLKSGANVNAQGGCYGNALQEASSGGRQEIVRLLLESGADVNAQGGYYGNALQAALSRGHRETVQLLRNHGALSSEWTLQRTASHFPSTPNPAIPKLPLKKLPGEESSSDFTLRPQTTPKLPLNKAPGEEGPSDFTWRPRTKTETPLKKASGEEEAQGAYHQIGW
ncbi:hypothetical protein MMC29_004056 [Sticta canariensis]|nr:hypothetical protein [Sticta canariensis]